MTLLQQLTDWLQRLGVQADLSRVIALVGGALIIAVLAYLANLVVKRLLLRLVRLVISRTETKWDDALVEHKVFDRLANLAPLLVINRLALLLLEGYPTTAGVIQKLTYILMIVVGVLVIGGMLNAANAIYRTFDTSRRVPLKGFFQVIKVVLWCLAAIVALAVILDKTPLYLLSGLGALTAVLLIVFKDPILGLVAGIQLSANKMVSIGDWISMPSHNADGDVIEVALTTVKVQNWDKTITTIPPYDLITRSFKNWRGMQETGGRRISRCVHLDQSSIRFCDETMLRRFDKIQLLKDYLARKREELARHNEEHQVDNASLVNGRRLTNVGTFRAYVVAYLKAHPLIRKDMTFLVRQLAPSAQGLPLQIYVFTDTVVWTEYEAIQSDIFDHFLAVVREFDLRVFQEPTGLDLREGLGQAR